MAADTPSFTTIPILDYSLSASPTTKPKFLSGLRNALVNVGFFYLINAPIAPQIQQELVKKCTGIFELPQKKKLEIEMINSKHFLGYSRLGAEITARKQDYREQFDVRLVLSETYIASEYANSLMRSLLRNYQLRDRRNRFIGIFGDLTRYAHAASLLLLLCSFLLQATPHLGLEVQNKSGDWIPAAPLENSLVVNIGRALEAITGGVCTATTHRVSLAPRNFIDQTGASLGPRFSIPVFLGMGLDLSAEKITLQIPPHIKDLIGDEKVRSDAEATFNRIFGGRTGEGTLFHRVISHQDVGRRWYPELLDFALKQYERK